MEQKMLYKKGDIVYHYALGQGRVIGTENNCYFPVNVQFDSGVASFTLEGSQTSEGPPLLSFTPYDLVKGGFSQDRPFTSTGEKMEQKISIKSSMEILKN